MSSENVGEGFHPTDEELIAFLNEKINNPNSPDHIINTIDICKYDPWELPEVASEITKTSRPLWYFFTTPDYKYANSKRVNRQTKTGNWKTTGKVRNVGEIGTKRILVFHKKGVKTNWVMQEFHSNAAPHDQDPFVLCRIKLKSDGDDDDEGQQEETNRSATGRQPEMAGSSSSRGVGN